MLRWLFGNKYCEWFGHDWNYRPFANKVVVRKDTLETIPMRICRYCQVLQCDIDKGNTSQWVKLDENTSLMSDKEYYEALRKLNNPSFMPGRMVNTFPKKPELPIKNPRKYRSIDDD